MSASKVMASSSLEADLFMESAFVGGAQPQRGADATTLASASGTTAAGSPGARAPPNGWDRAPPP
eukprot:CAMPEP_0183417724 /NCGR_PEP_ID=MMETSP0370-20130417/24623_1 /TAXON_ID=268820 /ORGANISM="Peridinium aciculiferum, Strain PAER-2" /LENGTH=64 /DNA_ID=CAMNT_0025601343 /DNA_START=250 /DNA_END=442 /DNA_ORIENTATION=-